MTPRRGQYLSKKIRVRIFVEKNRNKKAEESNYRDSVIPRLSASTIMVKLPRGIKNGGKKRN